jgi:hypothetical protein
MFLLRFGAVPTSPTDVKAAIHAGDVIGLRELLAADRTRANALIRWGKNDCIGTHPLHYLSDAILEGILDAAKAVSLVEVLLEGGSQVDFHEPGKRETPLMGAASLGAEDVGLRLLDAGAAVGIRGLFDETPLHWAAIMGLRRLVRRMIEAGADVNAEDRKYQSSPLGWALQRWTKTPAEERRGQHDQVVRQLVAAGAHVRGEWLESKDIQARPDVIAALTSG